MTGVSVKHWFRKGLSTSQLNSLDQHSFNKSTFQAIPEYVTEENIAQIITEKTYVLLAVDNHATRKLVSDHCGTKESVTLISGGIGGSMGHVQVYIIRFAVPNEDFLSVEKVDN